MSQDRLKVVKGLHCEKTEKKKKKTENGIKIVMPSFEDKLHISVDYFILSVTKCYTSTFDGKLYYLRG